MKKLIDFSDRVQRMMDFIIKNEGHKTFSAAVHSVISQYYDRKYYTKYVKKGAAHDPAMSPEELTPEQICEQIPGGKVVKENGELLCKVTRGTASRAALIGHDMVKQWWREAQKQH